MKRNTKSPKPLNESEQEELIRLRAENAYIKAENAVIKQIALRRQKMGCLSSRQKGSNHPGTPPGRTPIKVPVKILGISEVDLLL